MHNNREDWQERRQILLDVPQRRVLVVSFGNGSSSVQEQNFCLIFVLPPVGQIPMIIIINGDDDHHEESPGQSPQNIDDLSHESLIPTMMELAFYTYEKFIKK
ncbi:hypothetical protein CDAR_500661 [Caerostris darwini]|uniref:Uncharacterized protein n=1 Tax=Caerostris darwini TaxID=1538125 RepID=A0AAV4V268_9ARAC|nr:hypothetical protein CDAR_500661 [Caerostris darwini]